MSITSRVVISLLADPRIAGGVISQPALPFALTRSARGALGVSGDDVQNALLSGKPMLAFRFSSDRASPRERWVILRHTFTSRQLQMWEICSPDAHWNIGSDAHEVLSDEFHPGDAPDHPTQLAFRSVVKLFKEILERR